MIIDRANGKRWAERFRGRRAQETSTRNIASGIKFTRDRVLAFVPWYGSCRSPRSISRDRAHVFLLRFPRGEEPPRLYLYARVGPIVLSAASTAHEVPRSVSSHVYLAARAILPLPEPALPTALRLNSALEAQSILEICK